MPNDPAEEIVKQAVNNNADQDEDVDIESLFGNQEKLTPREEAAYRRAAELENALQRRDNQLTQYQQQQIVARIQQLPPDQQQVAGYLLQMAYQLDAKQKENEGLKAYYKRMEEAIMPLVKEKVVSDVSTKSGIEKGLIDKYGTDPKTAKSVAAALYEFKKKQGFEQRKATGVDNVPTAESQSTPSDKDANEIKKKYYGTGKLSEYIKAMREASN